MADGGRVIIRVDADDSGFKKSASSWGKIGGTALKGIAVGATAVATAVGAIGTAAIKAYGDYEQLVGGVETLFKDSADAVIKNAERAFQTAGLSANEYMETVTSFSASLLQSVGGDTVKAAQMADTAITDMSDNANKMGTSMEMIQNAYQGFAKQNYTMLDNLKLGYGGTKTEMERLLKDAQKISKIKYDISSFADITQAIHVIQTEMGITGTTAKEASTTIQGSFKMLKSSWTNLMTGLTDPSQNLDKLIDDVFNSMMTFSDNLMPRIEQVFVGITEVMAKLLPELVTSFTNILPSLLPAVVDGVVAIANTIIGAIPQIMPMLLEAGGQIINGIADGMAEISPILSGIVAGFVTLTAASKVATAAQAAYNLVANATPVGLITTGVAALTGVVYGLSKAFDTTTEEEKRFKEAVEEQSAAIEENIEATKKRQEALGESVSQDMAAIEHTEDLADELMNLVDANGNVTDANKARVDFILGELNSAYGTEYSLIDGQISKFGDLKQSIYDVIEAEKLKILQEAAGDEYAALLEDRIKYQQEYNEAMLAGSDVWYKYQQLQDEGIKRSEEQLAQSKELLAQMKEAYNNGDASFSLEEIEEMEKSIALTYENSLQTAKEFYEANKDVIDNIVKTSNALENTEAGIISYEDAMELATTDASLAAGALSDFIAAASNGKFDIEQFADGSKEKLAQFGDEVYKALTNYEKSVQTASKNGGKASQAMVDQSKKALQDAVANYVAAGGQLSGDMLTLFSTTGSVIDRDISKLLESISEAETQAKQKGIDFSSGYNEGIAEGGEKIETTAKDICSGALTSIATTQNSNSPSKETHKLGVDFSAGYAEGIKSGTNAVMNEAATLVANALLAIQAKQDSSSPAKETAYLGEDFSDGFALGIQNAKDNAIKAAEELAEDTISALDKATDDIASSFTIDKYIEFETLYPKATAMGKNTAFWKQMKAKADTYYDSLLDSEKNYVIESIRLAKEENSTKLGLEEWYTLQEKIINDRQKQQKKTYTDEQKEADKAYLKNLKDTHDDILDTTKDSNALYLEEMKNAAEAERDSYDERIKNAKEYHKEIIKETESAYKDLINSVGDKVENVQKLQSNFAEKLNDTVTLYEEKEFKSGKKYYVLSDISKQTKQLQQYAQNLQKLKQRGNVPKEFFNIIRDMSVEEGANFVNALLQANDSKFDEYIKNWQEQQAVSDVISKELYADETEEALQGVGEEFEKFNEDLAEFGLNNGDSWAQAFIKEVKSQLSGLAQDIGQSFGGIASSSSLLSLGQGPIRTENIYNTYNDGGIMEVSLKIGDREFDRISYDSYNREVTRRGIAVAR